MDDDPVGLSLLKDKIPGFGSWVRCIFLKNLPRPHPLPHHCPDYRPDQQNHYIEHPVEFWVDSAQRARFDRENQPQEERVIDATVGDGIDYLIRRIAHYPGMKELIALDADEAWYYECDEQKQFVGLPNIHFYPCHYW